MTTPTTNTGFEAMSLAEYIVRTPGVCAGQPRIAGTRIKVKHVYTWVERMGMTPAEVVSEYKSLNRAQVHAALAYYWSHQAEIEQDMEHEEKFVAELMARSGPSKFQRILDQQDAAHDPLSPG